MAVTSETSSVTYAGNGSTSTPYVIPFLFYRDEHLEVTVTDEDGVQTELSLTTDFTVTGKGDEDGGELVTVAAWDDTHTILIQRSAAVLQPFVFEEGQRIGMKTLEKAMDWVVMHCQRVLRMASGAVSGLASHVADEDNPHAVTKDQVGLGDVDNTSDSAKPISDAVASALAGKSNTGHVHTWPDDLAPTNAQIVAAIAEDPQAIVASGDLVDRSIGFYEDFRRYANGSTIASNVSMPIIGESPWWLFTNLTDFPGHTIPQIQDGAFGTPTAGLFYLSSMVETPHGEFSFGCEYSTEASFSPSPIYGPGLNMSFAATPLMQQDGSSLSLIGPVHCNVNPHSVSSIDFFQLQVVYTSNDATNIITTTTPHSCITGDRVRISGTKPTGVSGTYYYVVVLSPTTLKLSLTYTDAIAETPVIVDIGTLASSAGTSLILDDFIPLGLPALAPFPWAFLRDGHANSGGITGRTMFLYEVKGEYLTITRHGGGSITIHSRAMARRMGPQTYFWYESGGSTQDANGKSNCYGRIHRAWANALSMNLEVSRSSERVVQNLNTQGYSGLGKGVMGFLKLTGQTGELVLDKTMITTQNPKILVGGGKSKTLGGLIQAMGGNSFIEGGYLSNVGGASPGQLNLTRAPGCWDSNILAVLKSATTGSEVILSSAILTCATLEDGDRQIVEIFGNMLAGTKTLTINVNTFNNLIWTSGAITHVGPFKIRLMTKVLTAIKGLTYIEFYANNTLVSITRNPWSANSTYGWGLRATQDAANQVELEDIRLTVEKVKVLSDL